MMWSILAPLIDEIGAAAIGRFFLWRRGQVAFQHTSLGEPLPPFDGDLEFYYHVSDSPAPCSWTSEKRSASGVLVSDGQFPSPVRSGFPENDSVRLRRWTSDEAELAVIGLGGLVQLGYHWFDRLGDALARQGVDFWMMDEPFNHRRTPAGYVPGELIAGGGPEQLLAAVRQAVLDIRTLIGHLKAQGKRVGIVGQSYGGWLSLLAALVVHDLEFVIPLIPLCDLPSWYRCGLPLARGARRRFPHYSEPELKALLRPINPIAWKPALAPIRIDMHAATRDRMVLYHSIETLARTWGTRFTAHRAGHYSVFFGNDLRERVVRFALANCRVSSAAQAPAERIAAEPMALH